MQPITLEPMVINSLIRDFTARQLDLLNLSDKLKKFHEIYFDGDTGKWLKEIQEIMANVTDQNIRKMVNDLIGPKNLKHTPIELKNDTDYFQKLTDLTPDKLGISEIHKCKEGLVFYSVSLFNSEEFDSPNNYLYRTSKTINVPPGTEFKDWRLLAPYIRNAKSLEFFDPYLFSNPNQSDDYEFVFQILNLCKSLKHLNLYCSPNPLNILQEKARRKIMKEFKGVNFHGFKKYNGTKNVNHDRFIIIDKDLISIKFTTSFNNLKRTVKDIFVAKDSFSIIISRGRKYYE